MRELQNSREGLSRDNR